MRYQRTIELDGPPEGVWAVLTDGDELASWFGGRVTIEARVGGRVALEGDDGERRHGSVEVADAPHELVFRWRSTTGDVVRSGTRVRFVIEPAAAGCTLTVTEELLDGGGGPGRLRTRTAATLGSPGWAA